MADLSEGSKYRDVVESYMQNRLPQEGTHPSFQYLGDKRNSDLGPPPPAYSQADPELPLLLLPTEDQSTTVQDRDLNLVIEDLYKDADVETQHFIQATIAYEKAALAADPKYTADVDWNHSHTWEEVLEVVDKANQAHSDTSSVWGKVRRAFRSLGSNHKIFEAWINILPTQSQYASIVCGGLKVIFGAASRLKSLREEVCVALSQIPASLALTANALDTFSASVELHKCSSALYVAILATLEHILRYYKGNSAKRLMKATFKQDEYESKLSEKIKAMELHSRMFKDSAIQCSYQTQKATISKVEALETQVIVSHREVMQNIARSRSEASLHHWTSDHVLQTESQNSQRNMQDLQNEITLLREDQSKLDARLRTKAEIQWLETELLKTELRKVLKEFHRSNGRIDRNTNDIRRPLYSKRGLAAETNTLTRQRVHMTEQALATLEYEIELLPRNVEANLRHIWTIPLPAQDRAIALMKSPKLHTWLTSTHSSALFVNGNGDASARQSPLSFICSKLMDTVCPLAVGMRPKYCSILAQSFFCGQHVDIEDPAKGPVGMMRNLVSQILINYSAFSMPTIRRLLDIDPFDIRALCNIFSGLIKQLPRRYMVLFIIDGITFYEDSPTECEDATEAVQTLLEVMESCKRRGCMFKVLLTCPGNSRTLYREFDEDEEVIWLPTKVDPQGGLTPTKWEASAEPHVKEWLGDSSID